MFNLYDHSFLLQQSNDVPIDGPIAWFSVNDVPIDGLNWFSVNDVPIDGLNWFSLFVSASIICDSL